MEKFSIFLKIPQTLNTGFLFIFILTLNTLRPRLLPKHLLCKFLTYLSAISIRFLKCHLNLKKKTIFTTA